MNATEIYRNPAILATLATDEQVSTTSHGQTADVLRIGGDIYLLHQGKIRAKVSLSIADFFAGIDETSDYSPVTESVEEKFNRLSEEWRDESKFMSLTDDMIGLPSYKSIIGLGDDAVPLLLKELAARPDHWFYALEAITKQNPVPATHQGRVKLMAEDWLTWGRQHNLID